MRAALQAPLLYGHRNTRGVGRKGVSGARPRRANHADIAAERITQLGGEPNFNPEGLATRSHSEYVEGKSLLDMVREDLVAERIAVESYGEIIRYLGNDDPTTRIAMEAIMSKKKNTPTT